MSYFEVATLSDSDAIRIRSTPELPLATLPAEARACARALCKRVTECDEATYEAYEEAVNEAFHAEVAAIAPYVRRGLGKTVKGFRKNLRKTFLLHRYFDIVEEVLL